MKKPDHHPHAHAIYRVAAQGGAFIVEVSIPDSYPTMITGFVSQEAADQWVTAHRGQASVGRTLKRRSVFRRDLPADGPPESEA